MFVLQRNTGNFYTRVWVAICFGDFSFSGIQFCEEKKREKSCVVCVCLCVPACVRIRTKPYNHTPCIISSQLTSIRKLLGVKKVTTFGARFGLHKSNSKHVFFANLDRAKLLLWGGKKIVYIICAMYLCCCTITEYPYSNVYPYGLVHMKIEN